MAGDDEETALASGSYISHRAVDDSEPVEVAE